MARTGGLLVGGTAIVVLVIPTFLIVLIGGTYLGSAIWDYATRPALDELGWATSGFCESMAVTSIESNPDGDSSIVNFTAYMGVPDDDVQTPQWYVVLASGGAMREFYGGETLSDELATGVDGVAFVRAIGLEAKVAPGYEYSAWPMLRTYDPRGGKVGGRVNREFSFQDRCEVTFEIPPAP